MKSYAVTYERDEHGWWVATVEGVKGCHTQGKTLAQAERRIREALSLFIGEGKAAKATLDRHVVLPPALALERTRVSIAADRAKRAADDNREISVRATAAFVAAGISTRDIGDLFGVSAQRVSQRVALAKGDPRRKAAAVEGARRTHAKRSA